MTLATSEGRVIGVRWPPGALVARGPCDVSPCPLGHLLLQRGRDDVVQRPDERPGRDPGAGRARRGRSRQVGVDERGQELSVVVAVVAAVEAVRGCVLTSTV